MIRLINLCIFLSLTARIANAGFQSYPDFTVSSEWLTLGDQTDLSCCQLGQITSQCDFYADSRAIVRRNSSERCCKLTISGKELSHNNATASTMLRTKMNVYCKSQPDNKTSRKVTITVWRLSFSSKHIFVFVVVLGTLILISMFTFIIICVIMTRTQGFTQKFDSGSCTAQEMDTENQDANADTAEVQEEKTEIAEDELLYATVNYSAAGENAVPVVTYEAGTDYATVVMR